MRGSKLVSSFIFAILIFLVAVPAKDVSADGEDLIVVKGSVSGVIDGTVGGAEYSITRMFSNSKGSFQVQTYRHPTDGTMEEEIQFFFTINDGSSHEGDEIEIFFDLDHDHIASPSEPDRGIVISRTPASVSLTEVNLFGQPMVIGPLPGTQWNINPSLGTTWTAEVKLRASDLNLNFIPSLMGMFSQYTDGDDPPSTGNYPTTSTLVNVNSWANIKTRNPLEYVLLLDRSASMNADFDGNYSVPVADRKWTAAEKAADIFAQIFFAFRPTEDATTTPYFDDKIGLATYTWSGSCYGIPGAGTDNSQVVKLLSQLKDITQDGYSESPPPPGSPTGCTPIKRGLDVAFSMFSTGSTFEKVILLMSDGIHNRPSENYNYEGYNFPGATGISDYQVNTVALGLDEAVDTTLLQDINVEFSGFGRSYTNATEEAQLVDAFVENLYSHLYLNQVDVNGMGQFQVNADEPRLLVMLVWNSQTGVDRGFRILAPDNTIIDTTHPSYHHYRDAALDYEVAYYLLDFPSPTGSWQTIELSTMNPQVGDNTFALFDPTVYAFFTVNRSGSNFILKAVLKENGVPITEPDAAITAEITKPDQGFGTFASTAQTNCEFTPPVIAEAVEYTPTGWAWRSFIGFFSNLFSGRTNVGLEQLVTSSRLREIETEFQTETLGSISTATQITPTVESLPAQYAKVQEIFQLCDIGGLNRSTLTVELHDDGEDGDEVANDGIFTYRFDETQHEGTYTFDFTASGVAPSGSNFSRVRRLSAHKSVAVWPDLTAVLYDELFQEGPYIYNEYFVIPTDLNGEYLGPGHLNQVEFSATSGEWQTDVIDRNDGVYYRVLRYNVADGEPFVTPVVQGQAMQEPWGIFVFIILIVVLIVVLLLVYIYRLRKQIGN